MGVTVPSLQSLQNNMYTIKKAYTGWYDILDSKGEIVKSFDSYNYQKPLTWAKEWIKQHSQ